MVERKARTYEFKPKVIDWIEKFSDEQGMNKRDVVERAVMYYAREYNRDNLDDPVITKSDDGIKL